MINKTIAYLILNKKLRERTREVEHLKMKSKSVLI